MSRVLKSYSRKRKPGGGRKATYPWNTWLDGQIRRLTKGKDFTSSPKTIENLIRRTADKRKFKCRVHLHPNFVVIEPTKYSRRTPDGEPLELEPTPTPEPPPALRPNLSLTPEQRRQLEVEAADRATRKRTKLTGDLRATALRHTEHPVSQQPTAMMHLNNGPIGQGEVSCVTAAKSATTPSNQVHGF